MTTDLSPAVPTATPAPPRRNDLAVLVITCVSLFIVGLDVTVVHLALPSIGRDLGSGISGLQWAVDAYTVVLAALFLLCGSLGDRYGRKRVFVSGLVLFSLGSLACSLAPSVGVLVAARLLQALGGAMLNPVAVAIITNTFTDPRERAKAIGVRGSVFGVSLALGPVVGGAAVSSIGWRAIFLINIPIGIVAALLSVRYLPESRAPRPRRFDPMGQVLVAVVLGTVTFGIIEAPAAGWTSPVIVAAFTTSVVGLAALVRHERRHAEPLLDLRLFRSAPFSTAAAISLVAFAAFGGFLFINTLYLQRARGLSPIEAGLVTLPMALMTMVGSTVSGRMVARRGARRPLLAAGVCCTVGALMSTELTPATTYPWLLAAYAIFGLGFGLVNAPVTNAAVAAMPRERAGVASAIASSCRQLGQTVGVAVVGAIVSSGATDGSAAGGVTASLSPIWWTLTACGAAVVVLGLVGTSARASASAHRVAAALDGDASPLTAVA